MSRIFLLCSILLIAVLCCCGSTITDQMPNLTEEATQLRTEEDFSPTMTVARTTEEVSPTVTKTKTKTETSPTVTSPTVTITKTKDEENQELFTSHLPGINPSDILTQFENTYNLDCFGWEYFWDVWSNECITTGLKDPEYSFAVYSRNENTVDFIVASVFQLDPSINIILSYFEDVLALPYEGSNTDEILNWIESEIASLTPGDIRQFSYSNISYKLYGNIGFIFLEIGEIEQYLEP